LISAIVNSPSFLFHVVFKKRTLYILYQNHKKLQEKTVIFCSFMQQLYTGLFQFMQGYGFRVEIFIFISQGKCIIMKEIKQVPV